MPTYIGKATGNVSTNTTFAQIAGAANAELDSEAGTAVVPQTTPNYSATFTPAAAAIDGVAIKLAAVSASPSGTLTVILANNTSPGAREGTQTINVADLDPSGLGWYLPKFASVTPNGTDSYKIGLSTSQANQVTCYTNATANNWCRMLRLTTSPAAAPVAGDKLMFMGEWTGAGALTSFTFTWTDTTGISFGPTVSGGPPQGMVVGKGATLTMGTTASTAYTMTVKGILAVYGGGTLNFGTSGTRMPSTSSFTYTMGSVAATDSGLQIFSGATVNIYGNSRCPTSAITGASNATPIEITSTSHGLVAGDRVYIVNVGGNTAANGTWEVIASTGTNTFTIGAINGGTGANSGLVGTSTGNGSFTSGGTWQRLPYTRLTANLSAGTAVLTVVSSAMFANGDKVLITTTSQTGTQSEEMTISTVDSTTQITLTGNVANAHSGTAPTQAFVGLLTQNVKIQGAGSATTQQGFLQVGGTPTVNIDSVEFTNIGGSTTNKRGIDVQVTTGTLNFTFNSLHDCIGASQQSWLCTTGLTSGSWTMRACVIYNVAQRLMTVQAVTGTSWTADGNLLVGNVTAATDAVSLGDVAGTFTNNVVIGATSNGVSLSENARIGTFAGNTFRANGNHGMSMTAGTGGTLTNVLSYRNLNFGVSVSVNVATGYTWANPVAFGNAGGGMGISGFAHLIVGGMFSSDTTFTQPVGFNGSAAVDCALENTVFGTTQGIFTPNTVTLSCSSGSTYNTVTLRRCTIAETTLITTQASMAVGSYFRLQATNGTAGNHQAVYGSGIVRLDSVIYDVGPASVRMTPNSASVKLATDGGALDGRGGFRVYVPSGGTVTISVKVRESVAGDAGGANYNGARARLILRKNVGAGIAADVVLATATSASSGAWETISGTTPAVSDDATLRVDVDCDGTAGWINVDSWSPPIGAANAGAVLGTQFWENGTPSVTAIGGGGTVMIF